jgi:hypothetical protein
LASKLPMKFRHLVHRMRRCTRILCSCGRRDSDPDGTFSIVAPVSVRPVPMAPVGPRVVSVPIRAIVIAAWVIGRSVKDRKGDRDWQTETEEDPGLRLGLSQQGDSKDHRQYDNKFFHVVTDEKVDLRLHHAAKGGSVLGTVWGEVLHITNCHPKLRRRDGCRLFDAS